MKKSNTDKRMLVAAFVAFKQSADSLKSLVKGYVSKGWSRKEIEACAREAGYSKGHAANVVSMIWLELWPGKRSKSGRPPGRRKTEQEKVDKLIKLAMELGHSRKQAKSLLRKASRSIETN